MKPDTISNVLNEIMNAKKAGKRVCVVQPVSKLLIEIFGIMKKHGYIDYKVEKDKFDKISVEIKKLNECKAIKPRFHVEVDDIEKYVRRYLPARDLGIVIISTSKGLITDKEIDDKRVGGALIAYCF